MTARKEITWNDATSPSQRIGRRSDGAIFIHIGAHPEGHAAGTKAATAGKVETVGHIQNPYVPLTWIADEYDRAIAEDTATLNLRHLVQLGTWKDHALPAYQRAGEALK